MPLSREVFEQDGVSRAEPPGGAIADPDLHLSSGEENGVLAARRIVPIAETAVGGPREGDTAFLNEGHPGTVIDMAEATPVRMRIFDQVREAALNWDGRDPIRMNWPQGK